MPPPALRGSTGSEHHEIGMAEPDHVCVRCAPAALQGRGKRQHMHRSRRRSLTMKLLFEAPLDRLRRDDEGVRVEKRGGKPPAKDVEVGGRKKLRIIHRQKIMNHEHVAEIVSPLQPPEKDRVLEQVLCDIEIDRAVWNTERAIVEDAASQLLKSPQST